MNMFKKVDTKIMQLLSVAAIAGVLTLTVSYIKNVDLRNADHSSAAGNDWSYSPKRTVNVSTAAQLTTAISSAQAGDMILLADGNYDNGKEITISKSGTAADPIIIKAQNIGGANITGATWLNFVKASYITVDGLYFTTICKSGVRCTGAIWLGGSNNIRMTRNHFKLNETSEVEDIHNKRRWVRIGFDMPTGQISHHNRVDHNLFEEKHKIGNMISIDGLGDTLAVNVPIPKNYQVAQYNQIDHNYFKNQGPRSDTNGMETIKIGLSFLSLTKGFNTVEYNLFENCDGDPEVITLKSWDNVVRYNTIRTSIGVISLRHGGNNKVYGNFILGGNKTVRDPKTGLTIGAGGIRITGEGHQVYNNYLQDLPGTDVDAPIAIIGGDADNLNASSNSTQVTLHFVPKNIKVLNNTLVNNAHGIEIGFDGSGFDGHYWPLAPQNITLTNNVVYGSKSESVKYYKQPNIPTTTWTNNIAYPISAGIVGGTLSQTQLKFVDPQFSLSNGIFRFGSLSPLKNSGDNSVSSIVTDDVDVQPRSDGQIDIGADEDTNGPVLNRPLTPADVGPLSASSGTVNTPPASNTSTPNPTATVTPHPDFTSTPGPIGGWSCLNSLFTIVPVPGNTFTKKCLQVGETIYQGDQYTFTQVPSYLSGATFIQTANVPLKSIPSLSWSIGQLSDAEVYILYRKIPGQGVPAWISSDYIKMTNSDFSNLSPYVLRKNSSNLTGVYDIYRKNGVVNGSVSFGAALSNTVPAYSMYIVAVRSISGTPITTSTPRATSNPTPIATQPPVGGAAFPAQVLNLTNWKVTLPVAGINGPLEVKPPLIQTFAMDPWFVVSGNGVRFRAPVNGITTSGSKNPRSELRERLSDGTLDIYWNSSTGISTLFIDQMVTALPNKNGNLVVGQIHGGSDDITVYRVEGNNLWITDGDKNHGYLVDSNFALNKRFTVKLEVSNNVIKYYYNGNLVPYTQKKTFSNAYFKAGAYTQANCSNSSPCSSDNYGEAIIYNIAVTH